jgi:hypothetical protein
MRGLGYIGDLQSDVRVSTATHHEWSSKDLGMEKMLSQETWSGILGGKSADELMNVEKLISFLTSCPSITHDDQHAISSAMAEDAHSV